MTQDFIKLPLRRRSRTQKAIVLFFAMALLIVAGITIPRSFVVHGLTKLGITTIAAKSLARPDNTKPDKTGLLVIYATTSGFEPKELTTRPGNNDLLILNRSGIDNLEFQVSLKRGNNPDLKKRAALGSDTIVRLPFGAGEAALTEANHPNWSCIIKVVP